MKIAVNTRLLIKDKLDGIGWFTFEVLKRITVDHPEHHFYFIFDRPYHDDFIFAKNVKPIVVGPPTRHPLLYYYWFEFKLPGILRKLKADLFLSPDGYLSCSSEVPALAVMHDLNFEHYPEYLPWAYRKFYRHFFPKYAKIANRIATVSEFSRKDIANTYGIDRDKIDVVYNGSNSLYKPLVENDKEKIKNKFSADCPYFIFVGTMHSRKNIANLFKAFDLFKSASKNNIKLVMVGEKKWWSADITTAYTNMKHSEDIIFTGRLGVKDLSNLVASSLALTYVSNFEGFGIPLIEAMNCDIPIITSNVTSMPEIAGNAGLIVDPKSTIKIKEAMDEISSNEKLRIELVENGRIIREEFSWDITAKKLWASMEKVLEI
ncbi:MAG: glycosyltransferase family 4 protein [Flavobacteriales bacterium]|nr:glycosyltransferase family 4 protein [Flavobacteriales bacterium]